MRFDQSYDRITSSSPASLLTIRLFNFLCSRRTIIIFASELHSKTVNTTATEETVPSPPPLLLALLLTRFAAPGTMILNSIPIPIDLVSIVAQ